MTSLPSIEYGSLSVTCCDGVAHLSYSEAFERCSAESEALSDVDSITLGHAKVNAWNALVTRTSDKVRAKAATLSRATVLAELSREFRLSVCQRVVAYAEADRGVG